VISRERLTYRWIGPVLFLQARTHEAFAPSGQTGLGSRLLEDRARYGGVQAIWVTFAGDAIVGAIARCCRRHVTRLSAKKRQRPPVNRPRPVERWGFEG